MKKTFFIFAIAFFITGCSFAAENYGSKGYISVSTEASEEYNPTLIRISFAIKSRSQDPSTAAQMNKEASEKAINAVKALIDETDNETVKTRSYYFNPEYSYKDGTKKITDYVASNSLQVTLKDAEKTGKIISAALSNGANSINGIEFILEESSENCNILIQTAAKDARIRADKIAASMGTSITGIKSINAGCSTSSNSSVNYKLLNAKNAVSAVESADSAIPVETGKTKLKARVNADFYVK